MQDQKNLILAIVLSLGIFAAFHFLYQKPQEEKRRAAQAVHAAATLEKPIVPSANPAAPPVLTAAQPAGRRQEVKIESDRLTGSLNLSGGMIDDLSLATYFTTVDKTEQVRLLASARADAPYYARTGWTADPALSGSLPDESTRWAATGGPLKPGAPVTLTWTNEKGLVFKREIALDQNYLFTVTDSVTNGTAQPIEMHPFALVSRHIAKLSDFGMSTAHEGGVAVLNGDLHEEGYKALHDGKEEPLKYQNVKGWLGLSDKYWLVAAIPPTDQAVSANLRYSDGTGTRGRFQADYIGAGQTVEPGATISYAHRIFAGAKEVKLIDAYRDGTSGSAPIDRFDLAIDFGWYYFMTKPMLYTLDYLGNLTGNFGIAILMLTVMIKLLLFPLANKSYVSMTKMKKLTPQMNAIKERHGKDPQKMQAEVMALYKREGVNPLGGCLPILIQIPVFFSLYKVLVISLEMRHAPFFGWIKDLSATDPTSVFNLFGLIPWTPPQVLMIGALPLLMCVTMVVQQKMQPPPTDPAQARIMSIMPYVFSYMMAHFAAGLVVYWTWNNILSITQQYVIMRRLGVKFRD